MPIKNLTVKSTLFMVLIFALTGCGLSKDPQDPYEDYNRQIFKVNMAVDKAVLRPVAKAYNKILPQYAQARVTNFFSNFNTVATVANDVLQFQVYWALSDASRFLVNSTLGILGLYDAASKMKLPPHENDFGLTLAQYGMKKSPYVMIPILGPSTVRDEIGTSVDYYALSTWAIIGWQVSDSAYYTYPLYALYKLNQRAALLPTDKLVDEAFDPYIFVRDAYLQSRNNKIKQLRNIETNNGTNNGTNTEDTFVAGDGTSSGDNKDTFVPAGDGTSSGDSKDTFVPAGDEKAPAAKTSDDKDTFVPAEKTTAKTSENKPSTKTEKNNTNTSNTSENSNNKSTDKKPVENKTSLSHQKHKLVHKNVKNKKSTHMATNSTKKHHHYAQKTKKPEKLATTLEPVKSTQLY